MELNAGEDDGRRFGVGLQALGLEVDEAAHGAHDDVATVRAACRLSLREVDVAVDDAAVVAYQGACCGVVAVDALVAFQPYSALVVFGHAEHDALVGGHLLLGAELQLVLQQVVGGNGLNAAADGDDVDAAIAGNERLTDIVGEQRRRLALDVAAAEELDGRRLAELA